ncbi:hypothetical protein CA54_36430 [Symmachiella macrocystis]|uniref:Uncharacterized protein n=1 Tax=Symmachiella macrocystis TaxID=2527985 RepID=A0A5C6BVN3_9PLAN|nr:hypothetical protein CA54_36430 [Symmachiella macrocystis]
MRIGGDFRWCAQHDRLINLSIVKHMTVPMSRIALGSWVGLRREVTGLRGERISQDLDNTNCLKPVLSSLETS